MNFRTLGGFLLLSLAACGSSSDDGGDETTSADVTTGGTEGTDETTAESGTEGTDDATSDETTDDTETTGDTGDETTDDTTEESTDETTGMEEFTLTSPAFMDGEGIPGIHHVQGGNESPQLDWVGAPAGTMSFAVFFHDVTIDFEHSAIWNIDASLTGLPQNVENAPMPANVPGAIQARSWTNDWGYGGPGSAANFYQFTLYALDVADLTEVDQNSNLVQIRNAFEMHSLGTATLQGQSTGP